MTDKQREMIEYTTQDIIAFIMEDKNLNMDEAMELFYTSVTFEKLTDIETGLYLQGSSYVYELFNREHRH